ncbi:hypothetical protein PPL_04606 [Heterostelium album PN500]|uniref:FAD/NAD(P)-binding domain-containing protein n=1 Tax=Heterostelium pallidum (strain ATCC 26659 / Pp 5 / PN500) TaxID=670386 RepID=D3B816_HETP5|nr:hypothetical protein PPL_04606 [Heterostelium album PN500]EFA82184.1 hypothetical protein PPL_04606 [Heterostelium album PN500]|eukprot:XP_020434301.1 hypothetical protein PPL_04606 [Heterostelium album PN500]
MSAAQKKKVVIVGGGFVGLQIAMKLESKFEVVLIEKRQTFFHCVGSMRSMVEPEFATQCFLTYDKVLKKSTIIHSYATEVHPDRVVLDNGDQVTFDYLVIATGSYNLSPFKAPRDTSNIIQYYRSIRDKINQATKILVVGGGAVGVELAGEIGTDFKGKNVTLINRGDRLVSQKVNDKFSKTVADKLKKLKVNIMFNTSIDIPNEVTEAKNQESYFQFPEVEMKTYHTSQGDVEADLVFWTTGNKLNNEMLRGFPLDGQGQVRVNESFQVDGFPNVFAAGDICNTSELKTLVNAKKHIPLVASNIEALSKQKKLATYKPEEGVMIGVSIGRKDGAGLMPNGMMLPSFVIKMLKSKNMMAPTTQSLLNKSFANIGQ